MAFPTTGGCSGAARTACSGRSNDMCIYFDGFSAEERQGRRCRKPAHHGHFCRFHRQSARDCINKHVGRFNVTAGLGSRMQLPSEDNIPAFMRYISSKPSHAKRRKLEFFVQTVGIAITDHDKRWTPDTAASVPTTEDERDGDLEEARTQVRAQSRARARARSKAAQLRAQQRLAAEEEQVFVPQGLLVYPEQCPPSPTVPGFAMVPCKPEPEMIPLLHSAPSSGSSVSGSPTPMATPLGSPGRPSPYEVERLQQQLREAQSEILQLQQKNEFLETLLGMPKDGGLCSPISLVSILTNF